MSSTGFGEELLANELGKFGDRDRLSLVNVFATSEVDREGLSVNDTTKSVS